MTQKEFEEELPDSWGDWPPNLDIIDGIVHIDDNATPLNAEKPETLAKLRQQADEFLSREDNGGILAKTRDGKSISAFVSSHGKAILIAAGTTAAAATGVAITVAVALNRRDEPKG